MTANNTFSSGKMCLIQSANSHTAGYAPSLFWCEYGLILTRNAEQGEVVGHLTPDEFRAHAETMQTLGFSVSFLPGRVAEVCYTAAASAYRYAWRTVI